MIKSIIYMILLSICAIPSFAQKYTLLATIEETDTSFTTDPLGRIYTYSSGNLVRYSAAGKLEQEFSIYNRGELGYIDTRDPLKILLFFPAYGDVSILDAGFSENISFSLQSLGYPMSQLICISPRQGYWLYDPAQRKLIKLNEQLNVIAESTLIDRVDDLPSDPDGLTDSGNWVVMHVPGLGLLVFDQYGTYFKTVRIEELTSFQVSGNKILVFNGKKVQRIGISDGIVEQMVLPEKVDADGIRVEEGRLVIRSGSSILVYSYE